MTEQKQVLIIGAGYAGMMATVRLARQAKRANMKLTLINGTVNFVERLRLHQVAANQSIEEQAIPDTLKGTDVQFVQGWVQSIQAENRKVIVQTKDGIQQFHYDKLVYALGSLPERDSVPGIRDYAYVLHAVGDRSVQALREKLSQVNAHGGRLLVCGGGATGIEAAAEFAESFPNLQVKLVTQGNFASFINKKVSDYMYKSLMRLGVEIQSQTTIREICQNSAVTSTGEQIPFDVCLWTGGFTVPMIAKDAGLTVNERGQILIDPMMRSISHPDIYGCGDASHSLEEPGVPLRMSAYTALVMGSHVSECVSKHIQGKTPRPLSFAYYGQAIALGQHDSIGFLIYPADKAFAPYFKGKFGYWFREFFVNFTRVLPRLERRFPGALYWLGRGRYAAAKRKAEKQALRLNQDKQHGAI